MGRESWGASNFLECSCVIIMMKSEIIIFSCEDCSLARIERRLLLEYLPGIKVVELPSGETERERGALGNVKWQLAKRGAARKIMKQMSADTAAILVYGGKNETDIASAAAKRNTIVIDRNSLITPPAIDALPLAKRHNVANHALTFLSPTAQEHTLQLMADMAMARTGSEIVWLTLTECHCTNTSIPPNLTIRRVDSMEEAVASEPVDWYVDLDAGHDCERHGALLLQAMAAGVPFAATESATIEDAAMEECGITFAPNPPKEEFIRGLLPYIDSDFRSQAMSRAAHEYWQRNYSAERNTAMLAEEINKRMKS